MHARDSNQARDLSCLPCNFRLHIGRKEYITPPPQVIDDEPEISEYALQRAQATADAEVDAAIEAGSVAELEDHDVSDTMTVAEPDAEALAHDDEMMDERDRQDANVDAYDEGLLDGGLRGVLRVQPDCGINTLHARALDALTVHLHEGTWHVANYDSSQVATQFMDVIFCGFILDFWAAFERFHRLPYPDMLSRFKEGSRHDALGAWPIVELDESTGIPRDLTDAEIIESTRQPEMRDWRPKRYKMHRMLSIAVRGCIALGYERSHFNLKAHDRNTVRATMHVTMNRILRCVFGVKAYSYLRGNMTHVPDYLHIDPGAMLAAQPAKEALTELLILVQSHGFALPPECEKKYQGYLQDRSRRPENEMKILPIEYLPRKPTDEQRADAIQNETRATGVRRGYTAAAPSSIRPAQHPGPYPSQRPLGPRKPNAIDRGCPPDGW